MQSVRPETVTADNGVWHLSRAFDFNGSRIAWDSFGEGDPVVVVHGFPGNSYSWRRIAPALSAEREVYVFDMAGFGASAMYSGQAVGASAQASLLAALLDEWGLDVPAVVAHDFGASVTLGAWAFHGRTFSRIVLLDAATLNPCISEGSMHARKHIEAYQTMPLELHAQIIRQKIRTTMYGEMDQATCDQYFRPWSTRSGQMGYYRFLQQLSEEYLDDLEQHLSDLRSPTRIIWGECDQWISVDQAHRLKSLIPDSHVCVIPEAGHFVMDDDPSGVARLISEFLAAG